MNKVVPCEVYSRVVGYYRPVHNWNQGKRQEFTERKVFDEKVAIEKGAAKMVPLVGGGIETESLNETYKLFTFPNCDKCDEVKGLIKEKSMKGSVIDLKSPEGNKEFRSHYANIKDSLERDETGSLKLPIMMIMQGEKVVTAAQGVEGAKSILC